MAAINDLINQIQDPALRERIQKEVNKLAKQKKFGLVFEEHMPECTPLYDMPIKAGSTVAKKAGPVNDIYKVLRVKDGVAACVHKESQETCSVDVGELVAVAEFGESIYPYLKPIDAVCNAPNSDLWHTLIEADNYHALQLLEYLYAGKVDCIYIDPPYNTGAKDWKYNNDYVDGSDTYRHSKWLSFMQRRLQIAKRLLNPNDSVLIVSIDEKEYLHLGCLLEEMFPEANIQMVSSNISRKGAARMNSFTRVNEFIYFVMIGNYTLEPLDDADYAKQGETIHWQSFRRSSASNIRTSRPFQFYPIYVEINSRRIVKVGDAIPHEMDRFAVEQIPGCVAVFPVRDDGTEMMWGVTPEKCRERAKKGYIKAAKYTPDKPQQFIMQYLMSGTIKDIVDGKIFITGYAADGSVEAENVQTRSIMPKSQWSFDTHDARDFGSKILKSMLGDRFDFPKSLYAVHDCINYFVKNKPNALIVDFFAGSGTTLHAVNLLNAEDGGRRRCILVTNNEISAEERRDFESRGIKQDDPEWVSRGIARYVTWPRTVCSIKGQDINGKLLKGNYIGSDIPMANGFKANAAFFQLSFLDKTAVALGMTFKEMLPTLWMKAGAVGRCPTIEGATIPHMLILPGNKFAVLINENAFAAFEEELAQYPEIQTVFLATDYDINYRSMVKNLNVQNTYQLYRDYLDHFRLNRGRS